MATVEKDMTGFFETVTAPCGERLSGGSYDSKEAALAHAEMALGAHKKSCTQCQKIIHQDTE